MLLIVFAIVILIIIDCIIVLDRVKDYQGRERLGYQFHHQYICREYFEKQIPWELPRMELSQLNVVICD